MQAAAGRGQAHHVWEDNEGYDLVHVKLEQHAGDLSGARRIHRLPHTRGGGTLFGFQVMSDSIGAQPARLDGKIEK